MHFHYPTTLLSSAAVLVPVSCLDVDNYIISDAFHSCGSGADGSDRVNNPFDFKVTLSEDNTLSLDVSTKSSQVGHLAGFGKEAEEGWNYRECNFNFNMRHTGPVVEINTGDWDMKGTITLEKGAVARITARPYLNPHSRRTTSPNTTTIDGPTSDSEGFSTKLVEPVEAGLPGYCTGLDPGVRTFRPEGANVQVTLNVHVEKLADTGAYPNGYIGLKNDKALQMSTKLDIKEGCSRKGDQLQCYADRYGFELCTNSLS